MYIDHFRDGMAGYWVKRHSDLLPEQRVWAQSAPESSRHLVAGIHGPLIGEMGMAAKIPIHVLETPLQLV